MTDTSPAVRGLYRGLLLARSGEERLKMGCDMFDSALALARAVVDVQAPASGPAERRALLFGRVYGDLDPIVAAGVVRRLSARST